MAGNRTLSQVQTIAELAKLEESDLAPTCQCLYFGAELNAADMVLMEVENSILEFLETGKSVTIRGEKTDSAVLCLDNKTYDIKDTDTSNTLLILPECSTPNECSDSSKRQIVNRTVTGLAKSYYEVKAMRPKLRKLRSLLEECPYNGEVYEEGVEGKRYTLDHILDVVQASEAEIREELKKVRACHINGFWRMLHFDYECQLLSHILSLVEENSWNFRKIPLEETLDTLENLEPRAILEHTLECFGEQLQRQESEDEEVFYCLDEDKVCQMFAEMLLRPAEKFNLAEFLLSWQQSVPEGMTTGMHQLQGIAIIDKNSKPEVIFHFLFSLVPENEVDRFNFLFKTRDRWTQEEILPYIEDLVTGKLSAGALLQKHARASVGPNGVRVYNSKRPIK